MLSRERSLDEMEDVLCLRLPRLSPPRLELLLWYRDSRRESRAVPDGDLLRLDPRLPRARALPTRLKRSGEALRLRLSLDRLLRDGGLLDRD